MGFNFARFIYIFVLSYDRLFRRLSWSHHFYECESCACMLVCYDLVLWVMCDLLRLLQSHRVSRLWRWVFNHSHFLFDHAMYNSYSWVVCLSIGDRLIVILPIARTFDDIDCINCHIWWRCCATIVCFDSIFVLTSGVTLSVLPSCKTIEIGTILKRFSLRFWVTTRMCVYTYKLPIGVSITMFFCIGLFGIVAFVAVDCQQNSFRCVGSHYDFASVD